MSEQLALLNHIFPLLLKKIMVPVEYHDQVGVVKDMLRDDVSGLIDSLTDFAVDSANVNFSIEAKNPNLQRILNEWLDTINRGFKGQIPSGIQPLAKEYFKERWKSSSFPILKITEWEEGEQGLILPSKMVFVDGESIFADDLDPDDTNLKAVNFEYFLGRDKKHSLSENAIITKPYARWHDKYPVPFLIKRGIYHNWKIIQSLKDKETEILDQIIPYLLLVKKGTERLAIDKDINYTNDQLNEINDQLKELLQGLGETQLHQTGFHHHSKETPVRTTQFDEEMKHFIPDLSTIFNPDLFAQAERNILSGLGFIDVVEATSSSRRESILNPKAFIREIKSGVIDFKQILKELILEIQDKNEGAHRKLVNVETKITSSPITDFMTDKFKERVRQLYDRGLVSKQLAVELIAEEDFIRETERREKETDQGLDETMYPPITDNREGVGVDLPGNPPIDQNIPDDKTGPEADNFEDSNVDSNTGDQFVMQGKTSFDDGHEHNYELDMNGNGNTSTNDGHNHIILNFVVGPGKKNGHTHNLLNSADFSLEGAPFSTIKSLPKAVRDNMTVRLQRVWMRVFNRAFNRTASETSAFRQAWAVIRRVAKKVQGRWILKTSMKKAEKKQLSTAEVQEICDDFLENNVKVEKLKIAEKQNKLLDKLLKDGKE